MAFLISVAAFLCITLINTDDTSIQLVLHKRPRTEKEKSKYYEGVEG